MSIGSALTVNSYGDVCVSYMVLSAENGGAIYNLSNKDLITNSVLPRSDSDVRSSDLFFFLLIYLLPIYNLLDLNGSNK
jgi:hypothetical protein